MLQKLNLKNLIADWKQNAEQGNGGLFYNAAAVMRDNGYISDKIWNAFTKYVSKTEKESAITAYGDWQGA